MPPSSPGRFDVVGVGANSLDFVYQLPAYPEPGGARSKLRIERHERSAGGQTATVLAGCAALGLSAAYAGTIASGEEGAFMRDALEAAGVDTSHAIARPGRNPYALILLAPGDAAAGGERIVLWDRPAAMRFEKADVPRALIASARAVFVDDVDPDAAVAAAEIAAGCGIPVVTDIEAAGPRAMDLLRAASHPVFAEHVPAELTGEREPERALRALRAHQAGPLTVTLGARGAAMLVGDDYIAQPGFRVTAIDTTGAGDVFRAGYLFALLRGDAPSQILRVACAAAAVSCTRAGAIASVPRLAAIEPLLR
jgi:sugar/nucleoside kinase (ribokinase family)